MKKIALEDNTYGYTSEYRKIDPGYLIKTEKCGCCEGTEFTKLLPANEECGINFIRCSRCGAVTYDKVYTLEGLDRIYSDKNYYVSSDAGGDANVTFYGTERFARHLVSLIGKDRIKKKELSILDFGGGGGELSYSTACELRRICGAEKIDILVVDYTEDIVKSEDEKITLSHAFPLDSVTREGFDIVIASAVLEHLHEPGTVMKRLFDMTAGGGYIYFRTPLMFPMYKFMSHFGVLMDMDYPQHMWDFDRRWWETVVANLGYDRKGIRLVKSRPSIVERTFRSGFFKALAAHVLKAPAFIFRKWQFVGGWETLFIKDEKQN